MERRTFDTIFLKGLHTRGFCHPLGGGRDRYENNLGGHRGFVRRGHTCLDVCVCEPRDACARGHGGRVSGVLSFWLRPGSPIGRSQKKL